MEDKISYLIGREIVIWTREGLKFQGVSNWVDNSFICIGEKISNGERIIPFTAISNIELKEVMKNEYNNYK